MFYHSVLVIGGGLAGLRATLEARRFGDVAVLSLVPPFRSHSGAAQGGINAALGNHPEGKDDSWERHAFDTVKGSDYLADQDAVEIMCREAPERVFEMEHWGTPFSRTAEGKIAQRPFGGGGFPRTCYAADETGHVLLHTLYEQAIKARLTVYEERQVLSLVIEDGACRGVIALNIVTGEVEAFAAESVIMATGGYGRLYSRTTNSLINSGLGMALAYWAGAPLKDMEFVQFHPTTLYGTNILITEGARGEGAYLLNNRGERFMKDYAPEAMELAPRDIVARAMETEIEQGRGLYDAYLLLDMRHLGKERILERLPTIRDIAINFAGVDPVSEPIPIQPGQHYSMGGIDCDARGQTPLPGLYAAGECACVSVHGANRLGGNSLLETLAFGQRAGEAAGRYAQDRGKRNPGDTPLAHGVALKAAEEKLDGLIKWEGRENPHGLRQELTELMMDKVGIFRNKEDLSQALAQVGALKVRFQQTSIRYKGKTYNLDLARTLELEGMLDLAEAIVAGALKREESRGSHFRRDFPQRDDARFLHHTLARYTPQGLALGEKDVTITRWPPEARRY
ncbi:MAG: FAD-dependent oxidoreductase [Chloroflexi bacterium]|nr:FAD-dependent oxidoreductase [Chloroflexota bacterium]